MVSSTLARGLLVAALGFAPQAEAVCTRTITARSGDTCASLADLAGITVTQFLRSNPYVTTCEALISGATYCAEGTADSAPTAPAAPTRSSIAPTSVPSGGPLKVSTDGTCGGSVTCAGSRFGTCCSAHGFCGSTADYCGDGCQVGLGQCDSDGGSGTPPSGTITPAPGGVATTTTTITATIFVTNTVAETTGTTTSTVLLTSTSLMYANTTSTVIQSSTAIATATQTVRATVVVTSTLFQTSTIISNVTRSTTATSVAVVTSTSTSWRTSLTIVTRTVQVTSVEIDTLTTILTSTSVKAVTSTTVATSTAIVTSTRVVTSTNYGDCDSQPQPTFIIGTTPTFIIGPPRTTPGGGGIFTTITQIQPEPARPSPVLPGAPSNCKSYDKILAGDTCRDLATRNNVSLRDFYKLNPSIDCDKLWTGYYVCTGQ